MNNKILVVDDEPSMLEAYRRQLRRRVETDSALSGKEGLDALITKGPYAIVISDYRMPDMDGVEFLSCVADLVPETVRVLHTGYADLETAIKAVNKSSIFRLLTKPCTPEEINQAVSDGIRQYHLQKNEKMLLDNTLKGSLKMLTDILALVKPETGRSGRISPNVQRMSQVLKDPNPWETSVAALLSSIGFITLPDRIIKAVNEGKVLSERDQEIFARHPNVAQELVSNIPRLDGVAKIIAYQEKRFDGTGFPADGVAGKDIPLGARILKTALDFDALTSGGEASETAFETLKKREGWYDPEVLEALRAVLQKKVERVTRYVSVRELNEGMVLCEDVSTLKDGKALLPAGQAITRPLIAYLRGVARASTIAEPIKVIEKQEPDDLDFTEDVTAAAG